MLPSLPHTGPLPGLLPPFCAAATPDRPQSTRATIQFKRDMGSPPAFLTIPTGWTPQLGGGFTWPGRILCGRRAALRSSPDFARGFDHEGELAELELVGDLVLVHQVGEAALR